MHVALPEETTVGEVDDALEVGDAPPADPELEDDPEPDVDVPDTNVATGGPGNVY